MTIQDITENTRRDENIQRYARRAWTCLTAVAVITVFVSEPLAWALIAVIAVVGSMDFLATRRLDHWDALYASTAEESSEGYGQQQRWAA